MLNLYFIDIQNFLVLLFSFLFKSITTKDASDYPCEQASEDSRHS